MLVEGRRAIGLPVVDTTGEMLCATTDVMIGEGGKIALFKVKLEKASEERCLAAAQVRLENEKLISSTTQLSNCEPSCDRGMLGVQVQLNDGVVIGKVVNVLVEEPDLHVVGLELSNGRISDWVRGRPMVILESDDPLVPGRDRTLRLHDEPQLRTRKTSRRDSQRTKSARSRGIGAVPPPVDRPLDWTSLRQMSEDEIRGRMAHAVWERRGAPQDGGVVEDWQEMVHDWAADLKKAADENNIHAFDDVALLSDEEVEALRIFRV